MKILSVTNLYLKMLNILVIKTDLPLPPAVQIEMKMEKVKNEEKGW